MSVETPWVRVLAPAKVNLYLEVLGERSNGYHDIRSAVVPISLFDVLEVEKVPEGIGTTVHHVGLPGGMELSLAKSEDNLVTRAARVLKEATGYVGGATVRLEKHIPVGGGLGGGSSDAAAALLTLNRLWDVNLPLSELVRLGAGLGCDVPALLQGGAVCMEGLGERVSPLAPPGHPLASEWWIVLLNPGFHVSTRDIYTRCRSALTSTEKRIESLISALKDGDLDLGARHLFNGLQGTVFAKYPLIAMMAEALENAGAAGVLLCGSGASVFGLARNERHARSVAEQARKSLGFPVWGRVVRILPDGVMAAHGPLEARV